MFSSGQRMICLIPARLHRQPLLLHMNYKEILHFPKFLFTIVTQLVFYTFTEVETFLLAVVAVLIGWTVGYQWGLIAYFGIYFCMRMVGGYINLLLNNSRAIAGLKNRSE